MSKVAVILSGCGVYDGAEVNEAVLTALALEQAGIAFDWVAPDRPQAHVIDHTKGQEADEVRNIITESARITRGEIIPLSNIVLSDYAGMVMPGGFGVAKNFCNYAFSPEAFEVQPDISAFCQHFAAKQLPSAYICIAPILIPSFYPSGVKLTIGSDADTMSWIESQGGQPIVADVSEAIIDERYNVMSTPAYMLAESVAQAYAGISKVVGLLVDNINK